ncbi:MAG TPA: CoA pyrophosphatase [Sphingomicrobium sp.]|nr:CoA pyrophosphatase [Sphingomicrobium sp.]
MNLVERLSARLAVPAAEAPEAGDTPEASALAGTAAAVLIAVTDRPHPGVVLTVRREHLRTHAGQVAFPGGRIDPGEEPVAAALREAQEELALDPALVAVAGTLDPYRTITGYLVTPVLGVIPPGLALVPHDHEVADWFEAPLAHLLDPANQRTESVVSGGLERRYWRIEWDDRLIWGATAAMLVNLSRRLQWA